MEPSDFDSFIKSTLQNSTDLHKREREAAKPFIWSAVHYGMASRSLNWKHLAAAMLILLIGFSWIFQMNRNSHQLELNQLNEKIVALQEEYQKQLMSAKPATPLVNHTPPTELPGEERIVYRIDTIYQVDTVIVRLKEFVSVPDPTANQSDLKFTADTMEPDKTQIDEVIYPLYTDQGVRDKSESIQFKFGSFTARKD